LIKIPQAGLLKHMLHIILRVTVQKWTQKHQLTLTDCFFSPKVASSYTNTLHLPIGR